MVKVWPVALVAATLVLGAANSAQAVVVFCPGTGSATDREFSLDTAVAATCLTSGTGNINGNGDALNALGYTTLDKSDDNTSGVLDGALSITGSGGLSGTFAISAAAAGFGPLVIAFKSGEGQLDPDWAAFLLPAGVLSGSWAISGAQRCRTLICTVAGTEKSLHLQRRLRNRCPRYCSARGSWLHDCSSAPESAEGP